MGKIWTKPLKTSKKTDEEEEEKRGRTKAPFLKIKAE